MTIYTEMLNATRIKSEISSSYFVLHLIIEDDVECCKFLPIANWQKLAEFDIILNEMQNKITGYYNENKWMKGSMTQHEDNPETETQSNVNMKVLEKMDCWQVQSGIRQ